MPSNPTVGLLYPGHSAEDDFSDFEKRVDGAVRLPLVHTSVGEDAHRVGALLDLGSTARLAEGAAALRDQEPDALMWACTSGSFVLGWDGAHRQVADLRPLLGIPTSSTSLAFTAAVEALGVSRVAMAASYPEDVTRHFVAFLERGGAEVVSVDFHDIHTAAEVGTLGKADVIAMACAADCDTAEAVLIPDTALHSLAWLTDLEDAVGKPVLTAQQVTIWEGLRIAGKLHRLDALATLGTTGTH